MIKAEVAGNKAFGVQEAPEGEKKFKFSQTMAKILLKHFDEAIKGRGVFILIQLCELPQTKPFVIKQLKAHQKDIQKESKANPKATGLQILLKKLAEDAEK